MAADDSPLAPQQPPQPPQPPGSPHYPQVPSYPPYQTWAQPQRSTNGLAIASMVLGILWLYWVGSILALIFGYIARNQIRQHNQQGDGMAIAGIVLGWIGVGILVLIAAAAAVAAAASP